MRQADIIITNAGKKYIDDNFDKKLAIRKIAEIVGTNEFKIKARRREMVGVCQCGCGKSSQKKDDMYFRHSIAHIFPKDKFKSIMYHPLNWVERAFWGGCHTNMDLQSIEKWPGMADWCDIKEKFHILAPILTDKELKNKFYKNLEALIYKN